MRRMDPDDPTTSGLLLPNSRPQMIQPVLVSGYQLGTQMRRPARSIPPPAPILALLVQMMSLPAGMLQPLVSGVTMCPMSQSSVIVCLCRAASCVHHRLDRRHLADFCERFVIVCVCRAASCMYHRSDCRHLAALYERFVIVCVCRAAPCTHHRSDCWRSVLGNLCERFAIVFVLRSVACVHQWSDCWHLDSPLLKLSAVRPPTSGHPSQEGVLFDLLLTYISAKNKIKRNLPFPDLRSLRDHSAGVHSHN